MGQMRRAEERERLLRQRLTSTHSLILTWRTNDQDLLVNFLDVRSRLPICRQRVFHSKQTIIDLVNRTLTPVKGGPKLFLFTKALHEGNGEIQIEITGEQFMKLKPLPPAKA